MAEGLHVLVATEAGIEPLVADLEKVLGRSMVRDATAAWAVFHASGLFMDFTVYEADFENDEDLEFERFPYVLNIYSWPSMHVNRLHWDCLQAITMFLADHIAEKFRCECIVMNETLQNVIATFGNRHHPGDADRAGGVLQ